MASGRIKLILELSKSKKENQDAYDDSVQEAKSIDGDNQNVCHISAKTIGEENPIMMAPENRSSCSGTGCSSIEMFDEIGFTVESFVTEEEPNLLLKEQSFSSSATSPAPSLNFLEPNERQSLKTIIEEACQNNNFGESDIQNVAEASCVQDKTSYQLEEIPNEEPFDDSDADPDYVEESDSDDDCEVPKKKVRVSMNTKKINKKNAQEDQNYEKPVEVVRKKPGRRPSKNDSRKIREERKKNRNLGLTYTTKKGKIIKERKCQDLSNCRLRCKERISEEKRQQVFKEYWAQANFNKRVRFLASLITTEEKKTEKRKMDGKKHKNRQVSHKYVIPVDGKLVAICQKCLLRTLDETNRFLSDILLNKSSSVSGIPHDDLRGLAPPPSKTPEEDINLAKAHISSIPAYESHYCRKDSSKQYLPHYYTLTRMYDEYKKWLAEEKKPVSKFKYQEIFHSMGIKIKNPSKDTCATCDKFYMLLKTAKDANRRQEIQAQLDVHQKEAANAYDAKRLDKNAAYEDSSKRIYTFDLQQCLPTPDLQTSIAFYKRQLWTFNLTLHHCTSNQAICFMWHEGMAGRGANQIASCLYRHFLNITPDIKEVTLYSDTCAGQNKNSFLPAMFMMVLKKNPDLHYINHKFLIPGHTHMECDSDHSIIEKKKKRYPCPIEHPRDWINLVKLCGTKKPFIVTEMSSTDFFEFSSLYKTILQQRKVTDSGEKLSWKEIKWLRVSQNPGILEYKTTLSEDEPFKTVNLLRKGKTWPKNIKIPLSYNGPNPINVEKKKNLMELMPYISDTFHEFYKNLKTKEDIPNILPDINGSSEEEN